MTVPLPSLDKKSYKQTLYALQVELVKLQNRVVQHGDRILVLFEGRDAAGKDGTIKRITQHMRPRETRVVALGTPTERDRSSWYFQRYASHLPAGRELVLFNRSWYNRAGVERVMGFCTDEDYEAFMQTAPQFEHMLVRSGIQLFKYYLDISKDEQKRRLKARRNSPLKAWKVSSVDDVAIKHWDDYSLARNEMFARTHSPVAPWTVVRADDKRVARVQVIRDLLTRLDYKGKDEALVLPDPDVVFNFQEVYLTNGMIAP
ncbi:MAG: polyphosphate kinase 2 [Gammaproteobacteria bacterium]|jgi:polyphosphate kinase